MIFRIKRGRVVCSTGLTISPKNWLAKEMRARNTSLYPDSQIVNDQLGRIEDAAWAIDIDFRAKGVEATVDQIKVALNQCLNNRGKSSQASLNVFIEDFMYRLINRELINY